MHGGDDGDVAAAGSGGFFLILRLPMVLPIVMADSKTEAAPGDVYEQLGNTSKRYDECLFLYMYMKIT